MGVNTAGESLDLKARLGRIRGSGGDNKKGGVLVGPSSTTAGLHPSIGWPGWTEAGFMVLKRELYRELPFSLPGVFSKELAIVVPDLIQMGRLPFPQELLFFDLETTGLSGGSGTVAFLAAFGRFDTSKIRITQYLLLDYPGEADFVENVKNEFTVSRGVKSGGLPLVVSYNGKSFDSQIIKNRWLMNRIKPPDYFHADLLHPARKLWRGQIENCSQATIEVSVLGLDRCGDVSGAMAPDIWFSFLRAGENGIYDNSQLLSVCDHNVRDISGLAALFLALGEIAANPIDSRKKFRFNEEALALSWRKVLFNYPEFFGGDEPRRQYAKTGELLIKNAAENGHPRAAVVMAKIAEWRLGDPALALMYTNAALATAAIPESLQKELEKRRVRLAGKINNGLVR